MRYYDIVVSDPKTGKMIRHWTSHPNGLYGAPNPGALNVEFDVFVSDYGSPTTPGGSGITIHGIDIADLRQAQQFAGMNITLKGGMGPGLPLATPKQAGPLFTGNISQSFGNWVERDMTLDFVIYAAARSNFSVNWPAGTPLANGIAQTLSIAYPGMNQVINISPNLVFPGPEYGTYTTLRTFASFVKNLTKGMLGPNYPGVSIAIVAGQFVVYDGTAPANTTTLKFNDLVGQPTWSDKYTMVITTVMRADIQIGTNIFMPPDMQDIPGLVTTTAASLPSYSKYQTLFKGMFRVTDIGVRHVGHFRADDGAQWVSIFKCAPIR